MIFLNLLNRIFGPKPPLTRKEIEEYKTGSRDKYETELKSNDSGFNDSALEGWNNTNYSVKDGMSKLDKRMSSHLGKSKSNGNNSGMAWTFALFTLAMLSIIIFTYQGNNAVKMNTKIAQKTSSIKENKTADQNIDTYTSIASEKQITTQKLKNNTIEQKVVVPEKNSSAKESTTEKNEITEENNENLELPIQSNGSIPNKGTSNLKYKKAKEVSIHDLKHVDYRAYRNRPIKENKIVNVGVPANQANEDEKQESLEFETKEFTYVEYLSASSLFFSQGKYKSALKRYLHILKFYPDDVNANFYGGLCYFNLGQFDKAINLLNKSYSIGYGNFRQEAKWFSAKAHVEQKNTIKARFLLKEIIEEDGFYAEKAQELLNRVE